MTPEPSTIHPQPSTARRPKRRGRPRKPKRDHAVTLTLTLPNAAFRRHLLRLAKQSGHKTPSEMIITAFPLHTAELRDRSGSGTLPQNQPSKLP